MNQGVNWGVRFGGGGVRIECRLGFQKASNCIRTFESLGFWGRGALAKYGYEDAMLPPMVIKVTRKSCNSCVARVAWFYDELAFLHHTIIPCFGLLAAQLSEDTANDWDKIRPNLTSTNLEELEVQNQTKHNPDGHPV